MLDVQLRAIALLLASPVAWEYYINLSDLAAGGDQAQVALGFECGGGGGAILELPGHS